MARRRDNGGRFVTASELADKISALRWELRAYVLVLIIGVLLRAPTVATTAHAAMGWLR